MILVCGGTGTLGQHLAPLLLARGFDVRLLARHETPAIAPIVGAGAQLTLGDVRDEAVLGRALGEVDTVVSAIAGFGGRDPLGSRAVDREANIGLIHAARRAGIGHFVMLSIHQASATHPIELFRDKWAAEEALRASGLSWTILRPTAYLETWLGLVGGPLVATGQTRIFGAGRNPINFVSAVDVAQFVELALAEAKMRNVAVDVPGPENLGLDDLADVVEAATGKKGRRQHVPAAMMRLARVVTRVANPVLSAQIGAAIVMDSRDMTVDGRMLRAAFPSIPMTTAAEVATRLFVSPAAGPWVAPTLTPT